MHYARLPLITLSLLVAGCFGGPRTPMQPREQEWRAPVEILQKYADKEGSLTRTQLEAGLRRDFITADLNHDGVLEPDEMRAVNAQRWEDDKSAISPLQDWNGDGVVDFKEFAATPWALFGEFDRDHNGVLTANELRLGGPRLGSAPGDGDDSGQHRGGPHGGGRGGEGGGQGPRDGRGGGPQP